MGEKISGQKGLSKHTLIIVLGCLIPIGILAFLWAIGVSGSYLILGVLLLCPLLHLLMTRGMQSEDEAHRH